MAIREAKQPEAYRLVYLAFFLPVVLAVLCWLWLPTLAWHVVTVGFGYVPDFQEAPWLWQEVLLAFFALYLALAIGLGGFVMVAAWIWRRQRRQPPAVACYPAVSFVVPAYNEEDHVSRCVASLFQAAAHYSGF